MNQLFKKHRAKIFSGIVLGAVAAMAVVLLKNTSPLFSNNIDAANDYTIQFNSTNGAAGFSSSYSSSEQINDSSRTSKGNPIRLTYKNVKKTANKFAVMANGGYFYNPTGYQIIGLETINVTFTGGSLSLYSSKTNDFSGSATSLTSGTQVSIKANYDYFKIVSTNETTIDNIVMTYTCAPRQEVSEYSMITSDSELTEGQYLIVSLDNNVAFDGSLSKLDSTPNTFAVTVSADYKIADDSKTSGKHFTLTKNGTQWDITSARGQNCAHNGGKNGLNGIGSNTISISSDGNAAIYGDGGKALEFNAAQDQMKFRYLAYGNNSPVSLFKLGEGGDTPTPPAPSGDLPNGNYTASFTYSNPEPSSISILNSSDQAVSSLSTSISSTSYDDTYEEYVISKDEYVLIENSSNAVIESIVVNLYQYRNFDVYVDGSSTPIYEGDGLKGSGDPVTVEIPVNAVTSIKIVSNGGTGTYTFKLYSVDLNLVVQEEIAVTGVEIEPTYALGVGEKGSLTPTVSPSDATNKNVTWSSSNTSVATVAADGTIEALKAGTSIITVTTVDGSFTDTCELTVSNITPTSFDITQSEVETYVGDDVVLSTTIEPYNVTDKTIIWSSSDPTVATVENGTVHAVKEGTTTITAICGGLSDTCSITVKPASEKPQEEIVDVTYGTGQNLSQCTVNGISGVKVGTSKLGGTFKVFLPANAIKLSIYIAAWNGVNDLSLTLSGATTNPTSVDLLPDAGINSNTPFTLSGSEETYLHEILLSNVNEETELVFSTDTAKRCVSWGAKATVATSGDTPSVIDVTSVTVTPETKALNVNETAQLSVSVLPANATNKNVTWSSSSSAIATVDTNGNVKGIAEGTAVITATSQSDSTIKDTCTVTVTNPTVDVTGVSLSVSSKTITVDEDFVLTATVTPSEATNKSITWSSNKTSVATVGTDGTVHGVSEGTATITAASVSNPSVTASCTVTVESSGGDTPVPHTSDVIDNAATESEIGSKGASSWYDFALTLSSGARYQIHSMGLNNGSHALQWNANGYLYSTSSGGEISKVSAVLTSGKSIDVYGSMSAFSGNSGGTKIGSITTSGSLTTTAGYKFIRIVGTAKSTSITSITIEYGEATPVHISSVSIPETSSLTIGKTLTLDVTYNEGFNVETERGVSWASSKTNVATIDASTGLITAVGVGTTTITATSTYNTALKDTCQLTVVEQQNDKWTIMIYMCGADLESESGQASGDIKEILKVSNQPDDVNIIIETGGANSWKLSSSYIGGSDTSIPSNTLARWHVENKKIVRDTDQNSKLSSASMGKTSTYQSFLEWGLSEYPADKTGVILWNHGGGLDGVCFDEKFSDDALYNSEMKAAHANAIGSNKLEWIGYDACLMQNMEIAEFNSTYFNYQVASQESENGSGWYYTGWVDNLYNNNETTVILKEIVDQFITEQGTSSDQTLSYLNLNNIAAFKTAWENYASALKTKFGTSVKGSTFASWAVNNIKNYSEEGYCGYGQFDIIDWMTKCQNQSSYKVDASLVTAVTTAHGNLIGYNRRGSSAGNSNGVCCTYRCSNYVSYDSSETSFTNWRSFNSSYHA